MLCMDHKLIGNDVSFTYLNYKIHLISEIVYRKKFVETYCLWEEKIGP